MAAEPKSLTTYNISSIFGGCDAISNRLFMQQPKKLNRLLRALYLPGLDVSYDRNVYSISLKSSLKEHWQDASATKEINSSLKEHWQDACATTAEVLLPEGFSVEARGFNWRRLHYLTGRAQKRRSTGCLQTNSTGN
ncbi:MAG: hypothetical protein WCD53_21600 [Microcoleus sp.]